MVLNVEPCQWAWANFIIWLADRHARPIWHSGMTTQKREEFDGEKGARGEKVCVNNENQRKEMGEKKI